MSEKPSVQEIHDAFGVFAAMVKAGGGSLVAHVEYDGKQHHAIIGTSPMVLGLLAMLSIEARKLVESSGATTSGEAP